MRKRSPWTLRRAIYLSAALHVIGVFGAAVFATPRFKPPEEELLPVQVFADLAPVPVPIPDVPKKVVDPKVEPDVPDPLQKVEEFKPKPPEPKVEEPPPPVKKKEPEPPPPEVEPEKVGAVEPEVIPKKAPERPTLGDDVMIEIEGPPFEYAYYLKQLRRKISSKWAPPPNSLLPGTETKAKVYFRVQRGGRIVDARVESGSGSFLFDQAALRALEKASPLPPLPAKYEHEWLGIHLSFVEVP